MKKLLWMLILLMALPLMVDAQFRINSEQRNANHEWSQTTVYTKLDYTASTQDTTTWFNIEPYREIAVLVRSTDTAAVGVTFEGRNSIYPNGVNYTSYTDTMDIEDDSLSTGTTAGQRVVWLIKTTTLNRLSQPGNNQMRMIVNGITCGTTSGRYLYIDLIRSN